MYHDVHATCLFKEILNNLFMLTFSINGDELIFSIIFLAMSFGLDVDSLSRFFNPYCQIHLLLARIILNYFSNRHGNGRLVISKLHISRELEYRFV